MFFVDFANVADDRYLIVIDTMDPARNRIERVSDARFMEFVRNILDIEKEYAA